MKLFYNVQFFLLLNHDPGFRVIQYQYKDRIGYC